MTSASAERWRSEPHRYVCEYPRYPCGRCGLWPGHPLHQDNAQSSGTRVTAVPQPEPGRTA